MKNKAEEVLAAYRHSFLAFTDARVDSERCMNYYNDNTWTDEQIAEAKKKNKPYLRYNIVVAIMNALIGNEQLSRNIARFKPRKLGNAIELNEILKGRWDALADSQNIEDLFGGAFLTGLISKMGGWIERNVVMNEYGYLDFEYGLANNMYIYLDPETTTEDIELKKCRWIIKETWMTIDEIIDKYGDDYEDLQAEMKRNDKSGWWNNLAETVKKYASGKFSSNPNYDKENDTYKVLDMQRRVYKPYYIVFDGAKIIKIKKEEYDSQKHERLDEYKKPKIHYTSLVPYFKDLVVMDKDSGLDTWRYDLFPYYSFSSPSQVCESSSLLWMMLDAQDDINKGKSQQRDYVTQIVSDNIFIAGAAGEAELIKEVKKKGNMPNQVFTSKNPNTKLERIHPGTIPPEILVNTENSVQFVERTSSVNDAVKGDAGASNESGVLREGRVQRAGAVLNPYYKNLSRLRIEIAKDYVELFGQVYSEENRIVDIKKEGEYGEVMLNLYMAGKMLNSVDDISTMIEFDEGESNITTVESNFEKSIALFNIIAQVNPQVAGDLIPMLLADAPIPSAKKMLEVVNNRLKAQEESASEQARLTQKSTIIDNISKENEIINKRNQNART